MGWGFAGASSSSSSSGFADNQQIPAGGRLYVPPWLPAQTSDTALTLDATTDKFAIGFVPEVDFALTCLSLYLKTVTAQGNLGLTLHADGEAVEENGIWNGDTVDAMPTMTANNTPSPNVVGMFDSTGTNAEVATFEAFKGFNDVTASGGMRSNAAPTGGAPIHITQDYGSGNAVVENSYEIFSFVDADANVRAYPSAWTRWGSNAANPVVNTDTDWTLLDTQSGITDPGTGGLSRRFTYANSTPYRHYRTKITGRNGTNAYVAIGEFLSFAARNACAPGTQLTALATVASGASSGVWIRPTWTGVQLYRGNRYWIVITPAASVNVALSKRIENTNEASPLPDCCMFRESTNGGTSWTRCRQAGVPAADNVSAGVALVIESTTNHAPQLLYGRYNGDQEALYSGSAWALHDIPEAGVKLNCEALTALTDYNAYLYDSSGTLTLECSTTARVRQNGVEVKSGATTRRFKGLVTPVEAQTGFQGPDDRCSRRLVRNRNNVIDKVLTRSPLYTNYVRHFHLRDIQFVPWNDNDDYLMRLSAWAGERIHFIVSAYSSASYGIAMAMLVNREVPSVRNITGVDIAGALSGFMDAVLPVDFHGEGMATLHPAVKSSKATTSFILFTAANTYLKNEPSARAMAMVPC